MSNFIVYSASTHKLTLLSDSPTYITAFALCIFINLMMMMMTLSGRNM